MFHDLVASTCPDGVHWQHRAFYAAVVLLESLGVKEITRYGRLIVRDRQYELVEQWCGRRGMSLRSYNAEAVLT